MQVIEKRCVACGTDVSMAKRAKDGAGNYYCEPCVRTARERRPTAVPAAAPDPQLVVPQAATPASTEGVLCENCGEALGALQQPFDWQGHKVCWPCQEVLRDDAERRAAGGTPTVTSGDVSVGALPPSQPPTVPQPEVFMPPAFRRARRTFFLSLWLLFIGLVWGVQQYASKASERTEAFWYASGLCLAVGSTLCVMSCRWYARSRPADTPTVAAWSRSSALLVLWVALYLSAAGLTGGLWAALVLDRLPDGLSGFVAFLGLVTALILWYRWLVPLVGGQCRRCLRFRAARVVATSVLGVRQWTEGRLQKVVVRAGGRLSGRPLANMLVPIQARIAQASVEQRCMCRRCGYEWTRVVRERRRVG